MSNNEQLIIFLLIDNCVTMSFDPFCLLFYLIIILFEIELMVRLYSILDIQTIIGRHAELVYSSPTCANQEMLIFIFKFAMQYMFVAMFEI